MNTFLLILLGTGALSGVVSYIFQLAGPKDAPDGGRKTQAVPVPTSGGLAILLAIFLVSVILGLRDILSFSGSFPLVCGLLVLIAIVGAVDDGKPIDTKLKFFALMLITLAAAHLGASVDRVFVPYADAVHYLSPLIALAGSALWLFIMINASNFMDGSNGIAIGSLTIMISAIAAKLHATDLLESDLRIFAQISASAMLGFLFWNLQGKLYAGDAGSLFGGAVFASLGLYAAQDGNIWFPATLALPFLVDVFMTLGWRAMRRQNLLEPHRHHAYQGLIKAGWSHIRVALLWWGFTLICATAALWAVGDSKSMSALVFFGMLIAGCGLWLLHRIRLPEELKLAP